MQAIKAVPILMVAERLGVNLVRTGSNTWNQKDGKEVTSLTVFPLTNTFVRFSDKEQGGTSRGSTVDFVMHIRDNPDFKEACEFLSRLV